MIAEDNGMNVRDWDRPEAQEEEEKDRRVTRSLI